MFDDGSRWLFDVRPAELVEERDAACFAAAAEAALEAGWRDPTWRDLRHASDPRASYTHLRAELDSLAAALATAIDTAGHTHLKIASVKPRAVNRGGTIYDWEPDIRHPQAIAASEEITVSGAVSGRTAHGNPVAGPRPCRLTARVSFDFQAAYDELNPADDDYRFYAALAASAGVSRAVDLGCGTGTLARMLASAGAAVTGVDPDPDMLRVARARDPASRVDWRLGYSDAIEPASTELAVMSGHVAQVFTEDGAWLAVLRDLHQALVPGGLLAFESRNPSARKWEDWTRELALRTVETPEGPVEFWHETADVSLPLVSYDTLTRNLSTGHATVARDVLAFRDERALRATLEHAGFNVQHVYGDWDQTAPAAGSPELIVIARRP